jgi:hypothetical protein
VACYDGNASRLERQILCLNRVDGKERWRTKIESQLPDQDNIRENHGYASSTPVVDADRLYVHFGKSGVFAFDHEGKRLWQTDIGSKLHQWGSAASPMLVGDLVIVNASVESDALIALDRKTGKEVWRTKGIRESWNTPILVPVDKDKSELVVAIFGKILGLDPKTGEQLWSCATDIGWYMVPSLVSHEGVVYCVGGRNGGGALAVKAGGRGDVTKSHRLWTLKKGSNVPSPIIHEGHLYWMNDVLGVAYCVEGQTGKIVYEERVEGAGEVYASPVLVNDKIVYVSRMGKTLVLAAKPKYELLATNELESRGTFNASPAVVDGRLYIRSAKALYCIGK